MRSRLARLGSLSWMALLVACTGRSVSIDIVYPDPASYADNLKLNVIAIEPFAAGVDEMRDRVLVRCGALGVFPPTTKYPINSASGEIGNQFPPNQVLKKRTQPSEDQDPASWSTETSPFSLSSDANPWKAMLVHFEARGPASRFEGSQLFEAAQETLLEGCACIRFDENASSPDKVLDEEVRAACVPPVGSDGSVPRVAMHAIAPAEFRLEPCGITELTGPRGQHFFAHPGVCLRTVRCDQSPGGQACFTCGGPGCKELDDLSNVPVRFTIDQPGGASAVTAKIVLTSGFGIAVPDIQLDDCAAPIMLRAELVGRPDSPVDFPITCVPPVDFREDPDLEGHPCSDCEPEIAAIGRLPADPTTGDADRVVVLSNDRARNARLEVFGAAGPALQVVDSIEYPNEQGFAVHGYFYQLDPLGKPLLAVANGDTTTQKLRLHLYRWSAGQLEEVPGGTARGDCRYLGCAQPDICDEPNERLFACELSFSQVSELSMSDADINGDGFSDLALATDRDFAFTTYLSDPRSTDYPPSLEASCQCTSLGRVLPHFELISLGGPNESPLQSNVDLLMGDGTGAYVRYAQGQRVDGTPCDPLAPVDSCGPGFRCEQLCASGVSNTCSTNNNEQQSQCCSPLPEHAVRNCDKDPNACDPSCACDPLCTGRCVEPCTVAGGGCGSSPLRSSCVPLREGAPTGYCGGPAMGCSQPRSVWRLVTIHDVTKGRLTGGRYQDAIAVGAGSPVPGFTGSGLVRVMFGSDTDLTQLDSLPAAVRNAAQVDLFARHVPVEPSGPRSAEVADFNGDGIDDLAVLYTGTEEVRVWLGGRNKGPGEIQGRVALNKCGMACTAEKRCLPHPSFAVADLDRDGRSEILVICVPETGLPPRLLGFKPTLE